MKAKNSIPLMRLPRRCAVRGRCVLFATGTRTVDRLVHWNKMSAAKGNGFCWIPSTGGGGEDLSRTEAPSHSLPNDSRGMTHMQDLARCAGGTSGSRRGEGHGSSKCSTESAPETASFSTNPDANQQ